MGSLYSEVVTTLLDQISEFLEEAKTRQKSPLLVVCGPTASGKTALSLILAERFSGEIISADSAQVYRGMDIGSEKVGLLDRQRIPHHLIDVCEPDERFTMADFKRQAEKAISEILSHGKLPIICGGTGLYIRSVTDNYELPQAAPNEELRAQIDAYYQEHGEEGLHQWLAELDPDAAQRIHPNNVRYVARALEILLQTETPLASRKGESPYHVFKVAIAWPREVLYSRINSRVDEQIERGLLNELKTLLLKYSAHLPAFSALGYKELFPYLQGERPLLDCLDELRQNTRNFAKRQLTWFSKEKDIHWISPEEFVHLTVIQNEKRSREAVEA